VFSPKTFRHPYLLWSTLIASSAGALDLLFRPTQTTFATRRVVQDRKGKGPRKLDASYEVVGDLNGEGLSLSDEDIEEEVNGEEVRTEVLRFFTTQTMRAYLAGLGFTVSLVGLWGDGA
jgi:autophagy-related protein 33